MLTTLLCAFFFFFLFVFVCFWYNILFAHFAWCSGVLCVLCSQLVTETTAGGSILQRLPNGAGLRCAVAGGRVVPVTADEVAASIALGSCLLPAALGVPPPVGAVVSELIDLPGAAQMSSEQVLALYGAGSRVSEASAVVVSAVTFDSGTRQTKYADGRIVDVCTDATRITQYPCGRTVQLRTDGSVHEKICAGLPTETEILTGHGMRWVTDADGSQTIYEPGSPEGGVRRMEVDAAVAGHQGEHEAQEKKMVNTLRHVLMEIRQSEKGFSENVRALLAACLEPLRALGANVAAEAGCSASEGEKLFGWAEVLLPPHEDMCVSAASQCYACRLAVPSSG